MFTATGLGGGGGGGGRLQKLKPAVGSTYYYPQNDNNAFMATKRNGPGKRDGWGEPLICSKLIMCFRFDRRNENDNAKKLRAPDILNRVTDGDGG